MIFFLQSFLSIRISSSSWSIFWTMSEILSSNEFPSLKLRWMIRFSKMKTLEFNMDFLDHCDRQSKNKSLVCRPARTPHSICTEVLASTLLIGLRTLTSFNCYGGLGLRRTWRPITASCQDKCRTLVESCGISNGTLRDHVFESPGAATQAISAGIEVRHESNIIWYEKRSRRG